MKEHKGKGVNTSGQNAFDGKMERYSVIKKSENFYLITENYAPDNRLSIWLVIGAEKAALIDSGMGMFGKELRDIVEELTRKPVVNLLTHGHPDHIAGSVLFQDVYMNERDGDQIPRLVKEKRLGDTRMFSHDNEEVVKTADERCLDCSKFQYRNMDTGDVFDLGGVRLEILALPGHSRGSVAVLNRSGGYVMVGDAFSRQVPASSVTELKQFVQMADSIERFLKESEGLVMYGGHNQEPIDKQVAVDEMRAARELGEGMTEGDEDILIPISPVPNQKKHVHGGVAITYNPAIVKSEK